MKVWIQCQIRRGVLSKGDEAIEVALFLGVRGLFVASANTRGNEAVDDRLQATIGSYQVAQVDWQGHRPMAHGDMRDHVID